MTRGVPGTHDIELALATISRLKTMNPGETTLIPQFDKSQDNRKPRQQWQKIEGPVSVIILEGWCVASTPLDQDSLTQPINQLEQLEDKDGLWRKTSNKFLQHDYQILFKQIDWLLMLKAPDFDVVYQWRLLQEQKLAKTLVEGTRTELLDEHQIKRFIQYFQRLTEHNLLTIPAIANAVILLDEQHRMTDLIMSEAGTAS